LMQSYPYDSPKSVVCSTCAAWPALFMRHQLPPKQTGMFRSTLSNLSLAHHYHSTATS
jgi:hypothetical protein